MELEKQVCSLELAKKLKELGVKQESLFNWNPQDGEHWIIVMGYPIAERDVLKKIKERYVSAFTSAELGEMLPERAESLKTRGEKPYNCRGLKKITKDFEERKTEWFSSETEADARAKCLIHLKENKLI